MDFYIWYQSRRRRIAVVPDAFAGIAFFAKKDRQHAAAGLLMIRLISLANY